MSELVLCLDVRKHLENLISVDSNEHLSAHHENSKKTKGWERRKKKRKKRWAFMSINPHRVTFDVCCCVYEHEVPSLLLLFLLSISCHFVITSSHEIWYFDEKNHYWSLLSTFSFSYYCVNNLRRLGKNWIKSADCHFTIVFSESKSRTASQYSRKRSSEISEEAKNRILKLKYAVNSAK